MNKYQPKDSNNDTDEAPRRSNDDEVDFQPGDTPMEPLEMESPNHSHAAAVTTFSTSTIEPDPGQSINNNSRPFDDTSTRDHKPFSLADLIITESSTTPVMEAFPPPLESLPPPVPCQESLPSTATKSYLIDGVSTDFFVQIFTDRIVFGISQLGGKFGNYLMCQARPDEINPKHVDYEVITLLGSREDMMLTVYARQITERIEKLHPNPVALAVVLAVSLERTKASDPATFQAIVDLAVKLYKKARGN